MRHLLQLLESFSLLFSLGNQRYCYLNLAGITTEIKNNTNKKEEEGKLKRILVVVVKSPIAYYIPFGFVSLRFCFLFFFFLAFLTRRGEMQIRLSLRGDNC